MINREGMLSFTYNSFSDPKMIK